jgi:DNA-binding transcriptional MerR regulator
MLRRLESAMDPKQQIAQGATPAWALTPLDEAEKHGDAASERALEVLRARDPEDPRYETADDPRIPASVMFFKIGEVAEITGIKPYVLRYWEVEFPWIKPEKTSSRQRRYRRQDIALLLKISRLRYEEELTIERTRQVIREARTKDTKSGGRTRGQKRLAEPKQLPLTKMESKVDAELALLDALRTAQGERSSQLSRALADMRKTVLELLETVEE